MTFTAQALFPGDIHDSAFRLGSDVAKRTSSHGVDALSLARDAWNIAATLGWPALLIEEEAGGVGGGLHDLAGVSEGCGRAGLSLPLTSMCYAAQRLLALSSDSAAEGSLLSRLASGEAIVAVAHAQVDTLKVARKGSSFVLTGEITGVATAGTPTHYLLSIDDAEAFEGAALACIRADAPGLKTRYYPRLDGQPQSDLMLDGVVIDADAILVKGRGLTAAMADIESAGILLEAAEVIGVMGRLIEATIEYLLERKQFATALSTFQVLRHQVVDMYVAYENLRALVQAAFDEAVEDLPAQRTVSLLKIAVGRSGRFLAETAIQLHGGMGMTEELLAARLSRRLLMAEFERGGTTRHLTLAADATFINARS